MTIYNILEEREWIHALSTIVFLLCGMMTRNNFTVTNISYVVYLRITSVIVQILSL
jgi:hypothetical protein